MSLNHFAHTVQERIIISSVLRRLKFINWLSARKNFKGAKDNRALFLRQYAIISIVLSIVFF